MTIYTYYKLQYHVHPCWDPSATPGCPLVSCFFRPSPATSCPTLLLRQHSFSHPPPESSTGAPVPMDLKLCSRAVGSFICIPWCSVPGNPSWAQKSVCIMLISLASCGRAFRTHLHPLPFPEKETKVQRGAVTCPSLHRAELRKLISILFLSLAHLVSLH